MLMNGISTKIEIVSQRWKIASFEKDIIDANTGISGTTRCENDKRLYTHARSRLETQVLRPRQGVQLLRARQLTEERG